MNDEKKLTAEKLADACIRLCEEGLGKSACELCVTQAIKSADSAASAKARMEALVECGTDRSEGYAKGYEEGFRAGQIEMRERAAKKALNWSCNDDGKKCYHCDCGCAVPQDEISNVIRALPLSPDSGEKGERKS